MSTSELAAVWAFVLLLAVLLIASWWGTRANRPKRDTLSPQARETVKALDLPESPEEERS